MSEALIVCIGNDLVADDAVGHEVYRSLSARLLPPRTRLLLLGVGGMQLIDELEGERLLIIVDAVQFGSDPGTIHVLDWNRLPASNQRPVSGHGIGVKEMLQVCRCLYPERSAAQIYLVGVEGRCFDAIGAPLTPAVRQALPDAVETVVSLIEAAQTGQPAIAPMKLT
jgi:hydrogenase maturation protease